MLCGVVQARVSRSALVGATALSLSLALLGGAPALAQEEATVGEVVVTGSRITRRDFQSTSPIVTVATDNLENRAGVAIENTLNQLPQFSAGANNQISQAQQVQPSASSSPGASALNLRGLGSNRNLILVDGRRAQPANASMMIDINSIPGAAIESIEIITGGASAVYGADAISGVVNFKLKRNFQGLEMDARYGVTQDGGGSETDVSMLIGANYEGGRGNATFGLSYSQRDVVLQRDRDFYVDGWLDPNTDAGASYPLIPYASWDYGQAASFVGLSPVNGPSAAAVAAIMGPTFRPGAVTGYSINPDQSVFYAGLSPTDGPVPGYTGPLGQQFKIVNTSGSLGVTNTEAPLSLPLTRYSIFGSSHYDVSDRVTAFLQATFSETQVETSVSASSAVQFWGAAIPRDAAHPVPAELGALLASRAQPNAPWALQLDMLNILGPRRTRETTNTYQVIAGFRGDLPGLDWQWEVYGSHGKTHLTADLYSGFASVEKWRRFLAAPNYGQGATLSLGSQQSATCTSGFYGAIFRGELPSEDCQQAISATMKSVTDLTQNIVEGFVQGGLFELPAGEVRFALGADYREADFRFSPDPLLDVTSIVDAPVGLFPASPTTGRIDVKEGYGELLVPILRDMPAFHALNLELGARISDYNTAGSSWTYKAQLDWDVTDWLKLRGGYQRAERAPNVAELFQPPTSFVAAMPAGDPCAITTPTTWGNNAANPNRAAAQALCAALIARDDPAFVYNPATFTGLFPFHLPLSIDLQQGNPDLTPEKADTYTAGFVVRSPLQGALQRLTLAVDWYRIDILDAIVPLTSQTLYEQCFNADGQSNPTLSITGSPFCAFINRERGTGGNRNADAPFYNAGSVKTSGVDAQLDWTTDLETLGLGAPGALGLSFQFSWLDYYRVQNISGGSVIDYAGTVLGPTGVGSQFKWKSYATLSYTHPGFGGIGLRWRHLPSADHAQSVTNPATTLVGVDSHDEFDLFARWDLGGPYTVRFGIDNLFNTRPEIAGANTAPANRNDARNTTLPDYDVIGRRFYAGIKVRY